MTEQEKHAETLLARLDELAIEMHEKQNAIDFPLLCAEQRKVRAELIAALRQSPPPALAVEDARAYVLARMVSAGRSENDVAKVDALIAAVQSSRAAEPGTCATCRHYQPEDPIGGHCTDSPPNPMAHRGCGPSFGCIFHAPQEPSR